MQERRKEQRWPSYLGGRAVFAAGFPPIECIVRNTSGGGARLEIDASGPLPPAFRLRIPNRNAELWVETRWRGVGEMGVEAVVDRPADTVDVELSRRMRDLNGQTAALKLRLREMLDGPA